MEKRLLLAIVLSFVLIFLYQALFMKEPPPAETQPPPPVETEQKAETRPAQIPIPQEKPAETVPPAEPEEIRPIAEQNESEIYIDTPLYSAIWTNKGAALKSWKLKQHLDEEGDPLELVSRDSADISLYPFIIQTGDPDFDQKINSALFKPSLTQLDLSPGEEQEIRFQFADDMGNRAEKILVFKGGKYDLDVRVQVWKNNQPVEPSLIWGPNFGNITDASSSRFGSTRGVSIYSGRKVLRHEDRKFDPAKSAYNFVDWAAYDDQYYAAIFITSPQQASANYVQFEMNQIVYYYLAVNHVEKVYIGPKQYDILTEVGSEAKRVVRFGLFGFIAEILYMGLRSVQKVIPNWGLSIILLTVVIKILFFPLTYSSTKSMAKMAELQPKIKALKAKYKKAKQDIEQRRKLNEETMKLYKEHGVNPAGGCLPMLIQLPIFWGFFRLLMVAVEFRHSPFFLWITDLSVRDPYYITPILMGATQFISQKMTPTSGDATQQRMMLIMPVVMTIFFLNFPSGLILYWLTNNVLQIGQQYIMNRLRQKQKRVEHGKRRKK